VKALEVINGSQSWSIEKADCLEWLRALPPDSLDMVFGSPPYEQARLYLEDGEDLNISRKTDEWVSWLGDIFEAAQAACRGLVAFVVAGQTRDYRWSAGPALLIAELHRRGMNLRNPPLYVRDGIPGSGGVDWLKNMYEWVVCTSRPGRLPWSENTACGAKPAYERGGRVSHRLQNGKRAFTVQTRRQANGNRDQASDADLGRPIPDIANPGNLIDCGANTNFGLGNQNEAPFPLKLASFFVQSFCPPNGIAADCFSGSGTTLHACIDHGRRFVGCDIRQSQVDLTTKRARGVTPTMYTETA
jgi:hypothetical protein